MVLEEWNLGDGQLVVPKLSTRMGVSLGEFRLALKLLLECAAVWVEGFQARGSRHIAFEVVVGVAQKNVPSFQLFLQR